MKPSIFTTIQSPVGVLTLTASEAGLSGLYFENDVRANDAAARLARDESRLAGAVAQLREYFDGRRTRFELVLAPIGTPFQRRVWAALLEIPFGETTSYGELARGIGAPSASRAVGAANGRNPIAIIVPCHRVIGKSGSLTGFAGGLPRKSLLLQHESGQSGLFAAPNTGVSGRVRGAAPELPRKGAVGTHPLAP